MAPDLNSLPPSRLSLHSPLTTRPASTAAGDAAALRSQSPSPLSRSTSTSLQAAAAVNAVLQHEDSRRSSGSSMPSHRRTSNSGRRRSAVLLNLQHNDPSIPFPQEMIGDGHISSFQTTSPHSLIGSPIIATGDPHHNRAPSLGELHQELEQEQEAQVNRLLQMIRHQQQQLQQLQTSAAPMTGSAVDDFTPTSERSMSFSNINTPHLPSLASTPRSPTTTTTAAAAAHSRSSFDLARAEATRRSRTPSRNPSPRLRASSISYENLDLEHHGGRDESAFYQAETQMIIRENQMLRFRIRELERQVSELSASTSNTHEPVTPSRLARAESVSEGAPASANVLEDAKED